MAYRIILRRDTSANWTLNNPVLLAGEPGYETDSGKMKMGDGESTWNNLAYFVINPTGVTGATGSEGATGSAGATGNTGAGGTGANEFYGSQTISGPTGTLILTNYASYNFLNDAYAATAGIPLGGIYHNSGAVRIRIT